MNKALRVGLFVYFSILHIVSGFCQVNDCVPETDTFLAGEFVEYEIYYHWGFIWVSAGSVTFKVDTVIFNNEPCYNFKGFGNTFSKYNWIYEVNDKYEAWSKRSTLKPLKCYRDINEGKTHFYKEYELDHLTNTAQFRSGKGSESVKSIKIDACSMDALTMIYYSRSIDFKSLEINESVPISILLDGKSNLTTVKYLGKERIKVKNYGWVNTYKFSPKLIEGTVFNASDEMTVWITEDENKLPVQIESGILVGSINAVVKSYSGLKYKTILSDKKP